VAFKSASSRGPAAGGSKGTANSKAAAGVPKFLSSGRMTVRSRPAKKDAADVAADRAAQTWGTKRTDHAIDTGHGDRDSASTGQARRIAEQAASGEMLPPGVQQQATERYGIDGATVRIHTDAEASRLADSFGANAVTAGHDIFFASGRYAPQTSSGEKLLAHELAHVAQQGGEPQALQFDLARTIPVTLGWFDIGMVTQATTPTTNPGMAGSITFNPEPHGPYSSEIGLIQAINVTDIAGTSSALPGLPVDWSNVNDVNTGGDESGRNEMMTPGTGAPAGWYIDTRPSANPRGSSVGPNYAEHFGHPDVDFGWLRSPTDVGPSTLRDFPNFSFDVDFDFETVAKGTDNQTVYGALNWGFQIRSGAVVGSSEYADAVDGASATFEEALERFRGFYVHEPVVLYFDTNGDIPIAGEETKLADVPDYLTRYPDVLVTVLGFADERGKPADNFALAQRRADAVENLLLLGGVPLSRIPMSFGIGATDQFSQHGTPITTPQPVTAGRLRANRRVVVSFDHSVSNYPIVMP
jgi:outer membrane protein OmpA-like peptidoglycan-associated protein